MNAINAARNDWTQPLIWPTVKEAAKLSIPEGLLADLNLAEGRSGPPTESGQTLITKQEARDEVKR
jgi:hypothetical protein